MDIELARLASSGGTKLKIFDYMNAGLPISRHGREAMGYASKRGGS
ncbi:MAG: hypothetical protein WCB79_10555 [Halobacteriota archaeon]|jgi:hypothetical protein